MDSSYLEQQFENYTNKMLALALQKGLITLAQAGMKRSMVDLNISLYRVLIAHYKMKHFGRYKRRLLVTKYRNCVEELPREELLKKQFLDITPVEFSSLASEEMDRDLSLIPENIVVGEELTLYLLTKKSGALNEAERALWQLLDSQRLESQQASRI